MATDIVIIPDRSLTGIPTMTFVGASGSGLSMQVLQDGSLAWMGPQGQVFGITSGLDGVLGGFYDVAGLPVLEVSSDDKVVMGTFNSNALVVSGRRVGLGTASPLFQLDVTGQVRIGRTAPSAGYGLNVVDTAFGNIIWGDGTRLGQASYSAGGAGSVNFGSVSNHDFNITANGSTKATVTTNGQLLIGTIGATGFGALQLAVGSTSGAGIGFGSTQMLYPTNSSTMVYETNAATSPVLTLKGIDRSASLMVDGATAIGFQMVRLTIGRDGASPTNSANVWYNGNETLLYGDAGFNTTNDLVFRTRSNGAGGLVPTLTLTSGQNVFMTGVLTAGSGSFGPPGGPAQAQALQVNGNLWLGAVDSQLLFYGGGGQQRSVIKYNSATERLDLATNGSTRQVIDSNGNVGIGGLSPVYKLDVSGTVAARSYVVQVSGAPVPSMTGAIAAPYTIDFNGPGLQTLTVTGATLLSGVNYTPGGAVTLRINLSGSTPVALSFPALWVSGWVTDIPATLATGRFAVLTLNSFTTSDTGIMAAWAVRA